MPVSLGVASGSIQISTASLSAAEARARSAGRNITNSLGQIGTGAKQAQGGITGLSGSIGGLVAAYGVMKTATSAFDLGSLAATNERTRNSFDKLAATVNSSGNSMLSSLQKTSRGAIADSELILSANKAILLGAAKTSDEINQLLEIARVRGQAVGRSTTEAFSRIVQGVGKLEPEGLDELGLAINLVQVFDEYAKSVNKTAQALTQAEKRTALFNKVVRDSAAMVDAAKGAADDSATEFERLGAAFTNAKNAAGEFLLTIGLTDSVKEITRAIKESAEWLDMLARKYREVKASIAPLTNIFGGDANQTLRGDIAGLQNMRSKLQEGRAGLTDPAAIARQDALLSQVNVQLSIFSAKLALATGNLGAATSPYQAGLARNAAITSTASGVGGRTDAQVDLIKDWAAGVQSIERDANSARLDATQSYESQRSDTIRSYEQGIARDAQDFAISRARAAKQLAATIAEIQADAGKREADWQADLNESVATITAEGNSRVADIEADYQKSRERAEANHRENLFGAAARLDAVAVANEQRQFARSSKEAEVDFKERLTAEQESIQERIAQEQVGHQERLQAAREADEERINDARDSLAESQRIEDEDRALSAARRAEDHAAQLQQMAVAQGERMAQIARHATEERAQMDEEFKAALAKEGLQSKEFMLRQIELKRQSELLFDAWWKHVNDTFAASVLGPKTKAESAAGVGVDPGWFSNFNDPFGTKAAAGGTRSTTSTAGGRTSVLNIASGAVVVNAAASHSPTDIAEAVQRQLMLHYRELSN